MSSFHLELRAGEYEAHYVGLVEIDGQPHHRVQFQGGLKGAHRILEISVPASVNSLGVEGVIREVDSVAETGERAQVVVVRGHCHNRVLASLEEAGLRNLTLPSQGLVGRELAFVSKGQDWKGHPQRVYLDHTCPWGEPWGRNTVYATYSDRRDHFVIIPLLLADDLDWVARSRFSFAMHHTLYLLTVPVDVVEFPFTMSGYLTLLLVLKPW